MTTLAFLGAIAAIVVLILAVEVDARSQLRIHRPTGLFTWITSGNWPAKIGAALIIIGVGALLRFAALHLNVPPVSKLISGVAIAGSSCSICFIEISVFVSCAISSARF